MVRKREKVITPEEAIAAAIKEVHKYWHGTEPLFAAAQAENGTVSAYPLHKDFTKKNWLLVFADPTAGSAIKNLSDARELHRRYSNYGLSIILIINRTYPFWGTGASLTGFFKAHQLNISAVVDYDGLLHEAFGYSRGNRAVVVKQGLYVLESTDEHWCLPAEKAIQKILQESDPGLAMPLFMSSREVVRKDVGGIEFGSKTRGQNLPQFSFETTGSWKAEDIYIFCRDSNATLTATFSGTDVTLIAEAISEGKPPAEVHFEIDGQPPKPDQLWVDGQRNDFFPGWVRVLAPSAYRVVTGLAPGKHKITLKFPQGSRFATGVYGLRFSEVIK